MKKFTKLVLSCAAVAALAAAMGTAAMAADVYLTDDLSTSKYDDTTGLLSIVAPDDMDVEKEATLLVIKDTATEEALEESDIVGIDQATGANFDKSGIMGTPTEAKATEDGYGYIIKLGYYTSEDKFTIARGTLYASTPITSTRLLGNVNDDARPELDDALQVAYKSVGNTKKITAHFEVYEILDAADGADDGTVGLEDALDIAYFSTGNTKKAHNVDGVKTVSDKLHHVQAAED